MDSHIADLPPDERFILLAEALDCRTGLTFEELCDRGLLGGTSAQKESLHRTFLRYRDQFDTLGLKIEERTVDGITRWRLNTRLTYAQPRQIELDENERIDLLAILAAYLESSGIAGEGLPYARHVKNAYLKLSSAFEVHAATPKLAVLDGNNQQLIQTLHTSLNERRIVEFNYANAQGNPSVHRIGCCGFFRHLQYTYVVGMDYSLPNAAPRTFRIDRIVVPPEVRISDDTFDIPSDFAIEDFKKLPFEYGDAPQFEATYWCAAPPESPQIHELTLGRGTFQSSKDRWIWTISVWDEAACVTWSARAAALGLVVISPAQLVENTISFLAQTEVTHGSSIS